MLDIFNLIVVLHTSLYINDSLVKGSPHIGKHY